MQARSTKVKKAKTTTSTRARYTLEFKQEAVRLVAGGQSMAAVARTLGVVDQTLFNWVKADRKGSLKGAGSKPVSAEQMEIARLRAELARVKMERDILGKATAYFAKVQS
jgi:transposase